MRYFVIIFILYWFFLKNTKEGKLILKQMTVYIEYEIIIIISRIFIITCLRVFHLKKYFSYFFFDN